MEKALELSKKYKTLLERNGMTSNIRLKHFFAQLDHESGLKPISENLNYSANGLLKIFGKYFGINSAVLFARMPEDIANKVYANRMGNGNECSGDGWKYRGRGFIQLTGKNNYTQLSKDTGIEFINNPDLLLNEADAMIAALWFWTQNRLNRFSDADNVEGLTRAINGGYNGLAHRKELTIKYARIFK